MTDQIYEQELLEQVNKLDSERQQRLLAKVPQIRGESGKHLIASVGMFSQQDLEEMRRAIEEDCERID